MPRRAAASRCIIVKGAAAVCGAAPPPFATSSWYRCNTVATVGRPRKNSELLRATVSPTAVRASAFWSVCNSATAPCAPRLCAMYSVVSLTGMPLPRSVVAFFAVKVDRKSACCCGVASAARAGAPAGLFSSHVFLMAWKAPVALVPFAPAVHGSRSLPDSIRCSELTYAGDAPGGRLKLTCWPATVVGWPAPPGGTSGAGAPPAGPGGLAAGEGWRACCTGVISGCAPGNCAAGVVPAGIAVAPVPGTCALSCNTPSPPPIAWKFGRMRAICAWRPSSMALSMTPFDSSLPSPSAEASKPKAPARFAMPVARSFTLLSFHAFSASMISRTCCCVFPVK